MHLATNGRPLAVPIRVRFHPKQRGRHQAIVAATIRWNLGATEDQRVQIAGSARELDEAPEGRATDEPRASLPQLAEHDVSKEPTSRQVGELGIAAGEARDAAASLADSQKRGLDAARTAVFGEKERVPENPVEKIFSVLADLAVVMGVGALAQVVSKVAAPLLVSAMSSASDEVLKNSKLVDGVAAAMRDGMKDGIKKAVSTRSDAGVQARDRIAFFERQTELLDEAIGNHRKMITIQQKRYLPVLGSHPREVLAIFNAITASFNVANNEAAATQKRETMTQWASVISKRDVQTPLLLRQDGADRAHRGNEDRGIVTRFAETWENRDGVLHIYVRSGQDSNDRPVIEDAKIFGISEHGASAFTTTELRNRNMPMLFIVRSGGGVAKISRDEAGRIRATGHLPGQLEESGIDRNLQLIYHAEQLCNQVLGQRLSNIKTNNQ